MPPPLMIDGHMKVNYGFFGGLQAWVKISKIWPMRRPVA
jgi:hypothetical protein